LAELQPPARPLLQGFPYNQLNLMVRDGYYYALGMILVAAAAWWLGGWPWSILPLLLAAFFLWFFRDPERAIPNTPGAIVSPADGRITHIVPVTVNGQPRIRISIFLSVFNVHVNRSPMAGIIQSVEYKRGKFGNAMGAVSAEQNEQNIVAVSGEGQTLIFKQIAGLLARRIVFTKCAGDRLERGERVGLIKFGSRTDVIMAPEAALQVNIGDHVRAGSSVLALLPVAAHENPTPAAVEPVRGK
jgi:phosphatidylserine decarboxylase